MAALTSVMPLEAKMCDIPKFISCFIRGWFTESFVLTGILGDKFLPNIDAWRADAMAMDKLLYRIGLNKLSP